MPTAIYHRVVINSSIGQGAIALSRCHDAGIGLDIFYLEDKCINLQFYKI